MLMRSPTRWARPKLVRPPGFILPCQPILANKVPTGDGWIHELKHDGFRIIAHKDGERVHLWSRNGRDRSGDFVAIADASCLSSWSQPSPTGTLVARTGWHGRMKPGCRARPPRLPHPTWPETDRDPLHASRSGL